MAKAKVRVGFTRSGLEQPCRWLQTNLVGADIEATDGLGNVIKVSVREGGYHISLNRKDIAQVERVHDDALAQAWKIWDKAIAQAERRDRQC